jgi:parallel beta-helix repeat protein
MVDSSGTGDYTTITAAAGVVVAGDTVMVKPGTYDERVSISRAGNAAGKIVFKSQTRRTATVLHGFMIQADYIRIEGFRITHNAGGWNGGGIWLAAHNADIVDNYFYNIPGQGVSPSWGGAQYWRNVYVARNHMYRCNKGFVAQGINWLVEYNEVEELVYDTTGGNGEDADYSRFFGDSLVIRHNFFHGTKESEVGASHTDGFQTFNSNGNYARNVLIEYNYVGGFFHQGVIAQDSAGLHDITIRNNIFDRPASWGVLISSTRNIVVENNVFFGGGIHGIGFRGDAQGVVKNNIITGSNTSYWAETANGALYQSGYNLIFNCGRNPDPGAATDKIGVNPLFADTADILGPDGLPFTADDGLRLQVGSPALGAGEGGADIGIDWSSLDPVRVPEMKHRTMATLPKLMVPNPCSQEQFRRLVHGLVVTGGAVYDQAGRPVTKPGEIKNGIYLILDTNIPKTEKTMVIR